MAQIAGKPSLAMIVEGPRCPSCRGSLRAAARFCAHCGRPMAASREQPVAASPLPPRDRSAVCRAGAAGEAPIMPPLRRGQRTAPWDSATTAMVVGGLLALLGCFLPLAHAGGERLRLVPEVVGRAGGAALVPLACLVIVGLGAAVTRVDDRSRAVICGAGIALSSPGIVLTFLFARAAAWVSSGLDAFGVDAKPSGGTALLLIGFLAAMGGAFAVLSRRQVRGKECVQE